MIHEQIYGAILKGYYVIQLFNCTECSGPDYLREPETFLTDVYLLSPPCSFPSSQTPLEMAQERHKATAQENVLKEGVGLCFTSELTANLASYEVGLPS